MQGGAAQHEEEAAAEEDNQRGTTFSQPLSQESNPHSVAGKTIAVPSTPTFSFSFSPSSSPYQGTPGTKSPAFLFSLNSNVSTPGFTGFGFDANSSQEEDSSFAFASSLFHEKKATEKPSSCPEFLFGQTEPNEDFSFPFTAKSPHSGGKENTKDDLPFSFNF
ncbi:protein SIX6OS1 [Cololabis saira]|uniref:protein SIX6OS1 n=1 Tax=Cololabis saira TaxID=129043 RepID=UPI002AD55881|nr:protein SIX6OS1 [Cololabis saira]